MSGLIGALLSNTKSLNASSAAIEVAGKNLANVNNASYARQSVVLGDKGTIMTAYGPQSMGVEAVGLQNARDSIVDSQIMRELMNSGSLEAKQKMLSLVESIIGESVDSQANTAEASGNTASKGTLGLNKSISDFFNAFSALAAQPSSDSQKQAVLKAAQQLVDKFHNLDTRLDQLDVTVVEDINSKTTSAQTLLREIADINKEIAKTELRAAGSALDLRDSRQAKLEELAKLMDFRVENTGSLGQIRVIAKNTASADVVLLDGANVNGTLAYTGSGFTGGSPTANLQINSGELSGLQSVRTTDVANYKTALDALANQFVDAVNTAYVGNFFRTDTVNTALYKTAGDIQLDPALNFSTLKTGTTTEPGDNSIAKAIEALSDKVFISTDHIQGTFAGFYTSKVTDIGTSLAGTNQQIQNSELVQSMLTQQRESVSGVSTDEEMSDLMRFQRAFQGTARVINIMDEMLDLVVNRLGR